MTGAVLFLVALLPDRIGLAPRGGQLIAGAGVGEGDAVLATLELGAVLALLTPVASPGGGSREP